MKNIILKISICIFLFVFTSTNLFGQNEIEKIFEFNFSVIENYIKLRDKIERENDTTTSISMDEINKSAEFFEDLTGIYSDSVEGITTWYDPSRKNLKKWKVWYKKNKSKLYFDHKENKILKKD